MCPSDTKYSYGNKMKFVAITVNLTIWRSKFGYPTGLPIREHWEKFFRDEVSQSSSAHSCKLYQRCEQ